MMSEAIQPPDSPYELVDCPQCEGYGYSIWAEHIPCTRCGGMGTVQAYTIEEGEES